MDINFNGIFRYDGFEILDGIISRGVATLYYESGVPLAVTAKSAKDSGLEISWLNVARQFLQAGFSKNKVVSEFRELATFEPAAVSVDSISAFCDLDDEAQKAQLWEFWGSHLLIG